MVKIIMLYVLEVSATRKVFFVFFSHLSQGQDNKRLTAEFYSTVLLIATFVAAAYCGPFNQTDERI